jgi:hypothetical protein
MLCFGAYTYHHHVLEISDFAQEDYQAEDDDEMNLYLQVRGLLYNINDLKEGTYSF